MSAHLGNSRVSLCIQILNRIIMKYHCISLQRLQSGHSCVDKWGWCYTPVEMTQCLYIPHCLGRWGLNHYQRKLHGEVENLMQLKYIHDNDILNNTLRYHKYTSIAYFYTISFSRSEYLELTV